MVEFALYESPLGPLALKAGEGGLVSVELRPGRVPAGTSTGMGVSAAGIPEGGWAGREPARAALELDEYFRGERRSFDVKLDLGRLSRFDRDVLEAALAIPYGEVTSYGELARRMGRPGAARAVGGALSRNPLPIFIPCHRVVSATSGLGGFSGGLEVKRYLLALEGLQLAPQAI